MKQFLYKILCGFFLGISVFAPGFSGSIIAIIMGIYQDIVRITANPFKEFKKNVIFCIPLGIGVLISGVLFLLTFKFLFEAHEKATYLLFVGLIVGNVPVIAEEVKKNGFRQQYLYGGLIAFAAALALALSTMGVGQAAEAEGMTVSMLVLALGGLAAGAVALMPGMSISMIMILIGVYRPILFAAEALLRMDFTHLLAVGVFGACAVAGLVLTSKGIKHVFDKFPGFANAMVLGFMCGSLIGILVQSLQLSDANFNWGIGSIMLAAGLGISMLFVVLGKKMNVEEA